jgi:hypothetical protein
MKSVLSFRRTKPIPQLAARADWMLTCPLAGIQQWRRETVSSAYWLRLQMCQVGKGCKRVSHCTITADHKRTQEGHSLRLRESMNALLQLRRSGPAVADSLESNDFVAIQLFHFSSVTSSAAWMLLVRLPLFCLNNTIGLRLPAEARIFQHQVRH